MRWEMTEDSIPCLQAKVDALRESRDSWMDLSNSHAMQADHYRVEAINLKGRVWELERDLKAANNALALAREALLKADILNAELANKLEAVNAGQP
jgi:hypothetical protein